MHEMNERAAATSATAIPETEETPAGGGAWESPEAAPPGDVVASPGRPHADPRSFVGPESTPPRALRTPPIPSLAAIAGHPLHPMVVPLPIGAFTFALASDLAYAATHDRFWARASATLLGAGIVTGALAGALGATDFLGRERVREHSGAWLHAAGNVGVIGLSLASLAARWRDPARGVLPLGLALSLTTGGLLLVTGWLGGELAYRHKIGVTSD